MPSLLRGISESVQHYPDRVALQLDDQCWTYRQLSIHAGTIASAIAEKGLSQHRLVGLLATESLTAYAGVLAILAAGRAIVPIDPGYPPARIDDIIDHADIDTLVVGAEGRDRLDNLLAGVGRPMSIIAPEIKDLRQVAARHRRHRYHTNADQWPTGPALSVDQISATTPAYLSYTPGSTGICRSVLISHGNACAYLDAIERRVPMMADDRCSHTFPLTFDLSIHDLFTTWSNAATLVPWTSGRRTDPARFIDQFRLTRWFSVPTVALTMDRMGDLSPNRFPNLRDSLFCGEPLPISVARAWAKAAPNSSVINLYGPTEATVAITSHRLRNQPCRRRTRRGIVALGKPFEDQRTLVVDDRDHPVKPGGQGQLLVAGSQVTDGYYRQPEASARRYVDLDGRRWFRTGDLVEVDADGTLHFVERLDDQIQLRGHHIELSEVDCALRRACGHQMAAVVGWPRDATGVYGLVAMVATDEPIDACDILARCRRQLPNAMVPDRVLALDRLPTTDRGQIDRHAMQYLLQQQEV